MDNIDSYLDWLDAEMMPAPDQHATWEISDDNAASWALRKIAAAESLVAERQAVMAREVERLQRWVDAAQREALQTRGFFESRLEAYAQRLRDAGKFGKKRSWILPNGALQFRQRPIAFDVSDEAAFLQWCQDHDLVKTNVTPRWGEAKEQFRYDEIRDCVVTEAVDARTGEVAYVPVPGVTVTRLAGETFSVKIEQEGNGT